MADMIQYAGNGMKKLLGGDAVQIYKSLGAVNVLGLVALVVLYFTSRKDKFTQFPQDRIQYFPMLKSKQWRMDQVKRAALVEGFKWNPFAESMSDDEEDFDASDDDTESFDASDDDTESMSDEDFSEEDFDDDEDFSNSDEEDFDDDEDFSDSDEEDFDDDEDFSDEEDMSDSDEDFSDDEEDFDDEEDMSDSDEEDMTVEGAGKKKKKRGASKGKKGGKKKRGASKGKKRGASKGKKRSASKSGKKKSSKGKKPKKPKTGVKKAPGKKIRKRSASRSKVERRYDSYERDRQDKRAFEIATHVPSLLNPGGQQVTSSVRGCVPGHSSRPTINLNSGGLRPKVLSRKRRAPMSRQTAGYVQGTSRPMGVDSKMRPRRKSKRSGSKSRKQ
jgi:hypothetical protein